MDYPGHSWPNSHPWRLAAIDIMHGMQPPDVRTARVLELGCGDGANLIPMAYALPDASFTGIDLSPRAIARGSEAVEALGLKNIELAAADLMDYRPEGGFDFIIAHGLYSWVPETVREGTLRLCDELLSPHGMPSSATSHCPVRAIVNRFVSCFSGALPTSTSSPRRSNFVANARRHNLRFLGEAEYCMMRYEHDPMLAASRNELRALEEREPVLKEQYLDFLRAREFRQTLLCRDSVQLRPPAPSDLFELAFTSLLEPVGNVDVESREIATFRSPVGSTVRIDHPAAKAALLALHEARPAPMSFRALLPDGASDADAEIVARLFLVCLGAAYMEPYSIAVKPGTRPRANAVARYQITRGNLVASLHHTNVRIEDPLGAALLQLLDGTRDLSSLTEALLVRIQAGELPAPFAPGTEDATAAILAGLDRSLEGLGRSGILET